MPRLFVAIRPPPAVREALLGAMGGIDGARWQDDEQLHLTLAFVGEVGSAQARDLTGALEEADSPAFALEAAGVGHFERKGLPTAVWARVPLTEPLARLQRRVERACRRVGLEPEKRGYRPHITLARLPRSAGPIGDWLAQHGTLRAGPWEVEGFTLYESVLRPDGAHYSALVDYEF
jgi:2'-5' RNA ligase|uniref:RNA 2',3'-cyclic phosphodiesterase n=1 Tax=Altererythrobacter segetis TaxID=1104773 RepID=UPI00140B543B|nr:RNA 2',3'-cyclic phosphodiesterase [Altererythrobacter segetis]